MKRNEDFRNALGEPDEYFQQSVMDTLNQLNRQAERENRRTVMRDPSPCSSPVPEPRSTV